jgi:hypothetical protein
MKKLLYSTLVLFMPFSAMYAHELELVIDVINTPPAQLVYIYADAEDNLVFDENFNLTDKHSYKTIQKEAGYTGRTGFDFADDSQGNPPNEQVFYSIYKITINNVSFYINYMDCNYQQISPDNTYNDPDHYVTFDYNLGTKGKFIWYGNAYDVVNDTGMELAQGDTINIWRIHPDWPVNNSVPDGEPYSPKTSCFNPKVYGKNVFETYENFGQLEFDNSITINSGEYVNFEMNTQHSIKTSDQVHYDVGGVSTNDVQHHDWDRISSKYLLTDNFNVSAWTVTKEAQFKKMDASTLNTKLLSGGSGGKIWFKDPWFIEGDGSQPGIFHQYSAPYLPANGYGLFLNQNVYFNPQFPIYSVKSDDKQPIDINGEQVEHYFKGWEGTDVDIENPSQNETVVVFKNPGAEIRAKYKGHNLSNTSNALGGNGQQNIFRFNDVGKYYLIYEDHGEIYLTWSSDGQSWHEEVQVSSANGNASSPSLYSDDLEQYMVWQENNKIQFRKGHLNGGDTYVLDNIKTAGYSYVANARPVISRGMRSGSGGGGQGPSRMAAGGPQPPKPLTYIFFQQYSSVIKGYYKWDDSANWYVGLTITGRYPAIAANINFFDPDNIVIAYENNGTIYFKRYTSYWSTQYRVSPNYSWLTNLKNPDVSYVDTKAHFVWEGVDSRDGGTYTYYININDNNNSSSFTSFAGDGPQNPSIGVSTNGSKISIYHQNGENIIKEHKNGSWNQTTYSSSQPMIYPCVSPYSSGNAIYLAGNDIPYFIKRIEDFPLAKSSETIEIMEPKLMVPNKTQLYDAYPNPFNPSTKIRYSLPEGTMISLSVYDIHGKLVHTIVDGFQESGEYETNFNGKDLASGIYLYRLTTPTRTLVKRMLLLK